MQERVHAEAAAAPRSALAVIATRSRTKFGPAQPSMLQCIKLWWSGAEDHGPPQPELTQEVWEQLFASAENARRTMKMGSRSIEQHMTEEGLFEVASGLKWQICDEADAITGQILENVELKEALTVKMEFTQEEWDVFGITDLRMDHFVKTSKSCFRPAAAHIDALSLVGQLRGRMARVLFKRVVTIFLGLLQAAPSGLKTPAEAPAPCNLCGSTCGVDELCDELDMHKRVGIKPFELQTASGLRWKMTGTTKPTQGRELTNPALAKALASKPVPMFTQKEWIGFGIEDLREDDFIKSKPSLQRENTGRTKPTQGRELHNSDLARALSRMTTGQVIPDAKAEDVYFKPFNPKSNDRIEVGDLVQRTTDPSKLGVVEEDDGESYRVRWENNSLSGWLASGWLAPGDIILAQEKSADPHVSIGTCSRCGKALKEASGLRWRKAGNTEPTEGRRLANTKLADALIHTTEFTQQEWDGFGIKKLSMDHFVVIESGDSYFKPSEFKVSMGTLVRTTETVMATSKPMKEPKEVPKNSLGRVVMIDEDGDADVMFKGRGVMRVHKKEFVKLCAEEGNLGSDLQTLLEECHLALRSDVAFKGMDTDKSDTISLDELRKGLLKRGTTPDAISALFRSMHSSEGGEISRSDFFFASFDPIVMKHTQKLFSARTMHDQWYHILHLFAVMEDQIPDLIAKLLAAAPRSLVGVLVTNVMSKLLNTCILHSQHHDPRLIFEKMVKGCTNLSDLVKSISSVPFAVSTLIKIHEASADSDLEHRPGEIIGFLRDIFAQQAREKLKITQESGQFIVDLLVNDDDVRSMAQHPDRILSQMLKRLAEGKDKQQLLCIGHESFREILEKWLSSLQQMSGIPFQDEEFRSIVSTALHAFDIELAELLLSLSTNDASSKESLKDGDMVNALKLSIHLIHSSFKQNESLLEGFLKQAMCLILVCLGMQRGQAKIFVNEMSWGKVRVELAKIFTGRDRPPLKLVLFYLCNFLEKDALHLAEEDAMSDSTSTLKHRLKKRLTEDIRDYLYCEVTRMLMFLGLKSTGSHGRIIRLVLQPHLKRVGMDWEDVDSLLKDLREDDLKKCSKTGNLGPILQNILPRMAVTHRDAAKKLMVAHLQRLLLPQLEKTGVDVTSVLDVILSECHQGDLEACLKSANTEPFLQKLAEASKPLTKAWVVAKIYQQLESRVGTTVTREHIDLVFKDTITECVESDCIVPTLVSKLTEACRTLAKQVMMDRLMLTLEAQIKKSGFAGEVAATVLNVITMKDLDSCEESGDSTSILEKLVTHIGTPAIAKILKSGAFELAIMQTCSEYKELISALLTGIEKALDARESLQTALQETKGDCNRFNIVNVDQFNTAVDAGIDVEEDEFEELINVVVDSVVPKWKIIAQIVTDPSSRLELFLQSLDSSCSSDAADNQRLRRRRDILLQILTRTLRVKLVQQGIVEEDAERLLHFFKKHHLDLTQGFSSPQSAVQKMISLFDKLQNQVEEEAWSLVAQNEADLLLRCARAVAVHYVQAQIANSCYGDSRSAELVEAFFERLPVDKLSEAMTHNPRRLVKSVLQQAANSGIEFVHKWLQECTADIKEEGIAQLMAGENGMPWDRANAMIQQTEEWLQDPSQVPEYLNKLSDIAPQEIIDQVSQGLATFGVAYLFFYLKERVLPVADLVSDVAMAANLCDARYIEPSLQDQTVRYLLRTLAWPIYTAGGYDLALWKVEADNSTVYIVTREYNSTINATVEVLEEYRSRDAGDQYTTFLDTIKCTYGGDEYPQHMETRQAFFVATLVFIILPLTVQYCAVLGAWIRQQDSLKEQISLLLFGLAMLPFGVVGILLMEIYMFLFSSGRQMQGAFWSSFENLKRVLDSFLESFFQAFIQVSFTLWRWSTQQLTWDTLSSDSEFYISLCSLVASILQCYKIYHNLADLRVSYGFTWSELLQALVSVGRDSHVPFLLVLRSWDNVDYSSESDTLGQHPNETRKIAEIARALVGNTMLKRLTLGAHQVSEKRMEVLSQALQGNQHLQAFAVLERPQMTDSALGSEEEKRGIRARRFFEERMSSDEWELRLSDPNFGETFIKTIPENEIVILVQTEEALTVQHDPDLNEIKQEPSNSYIKAALENAYFKLGDMHIKSAVIVHSTDDGLRQESTKGIRSDRGQRFLSTRFLPDSYQTLIGIWLKGNWFQILFGGQAGRSARKKLRKDIGVFQQAREDEKKQSVKRATLFRVKGAIQNTTFVKTLEDHIKQKLVEDNITDSPQVHIFFDNIARLPGTCVSNFAENLPVSLRSLRLHSILFDAKHWATLPHALIRLKNLESFAISYSPSTENLTGGHVQKRVQEASRMFTSMRSLKELCLQHMPPGVLSILLQSGLGASKTIRTLDVSFNSLDPAAIGALTTWAQKGSLKEILCLGITVVSCHDGRVSSSRTSVRELDKLVLATGSRRCLLEVLVITIAHSPRRQGTAKRGAVSDKDLANLAQVCQTAAATTRSCRFLSVGLHNDDARSISRDSIIDQLHTVIRFFLFIGCIITVVLVCLDMSKRGLFFQHLYDCDDLPHWVLNSCVARSESADLLARKRREVFAWFAVGVVYLILYWPVFDPRGPLRKIGSGFRFLIHTLIPCGWIRITNDDIESVLKAQQLEHAGKIGGDHGMSRACLALHESRAHVLYLMLRNLPESLALDFRVVMHDLFRFAVGTDREKKVAAFRVVRLESCGISSANLPEWLNFFLLCRRLKLVENPLDRASLRDLRVFLHKSLYTGWRKWFSCWEVPSSESPRLKALELWNTTPVSPDVGLELVRMAYELDIECSLGKHRRFRFSRSFVAKGAEKVMRTEFTNVAEFLKDGLRPVWTRTGLRSRYSVRLSGLWCLGSCYRMALSWMGLDGRDRWSKLMDNFHRMQTGDFDSCVADYIELHTSATATRARERAQRPALRALPRLAAGVAARLPPSLAARIDTAAWVDWRAQSDPLSQANLLFMVYSCAISEIQTIDLSDRGMEDDSMGALASILPLATSLLKLDLSRNKISHKGVSALQACEAMQTLTRLNTLNMSGNALHDEGVKALAPILPFITSLDLSNTKISGKAVSTLATVLDASHSLQRLNMSGNCIGDDEAAVLGKVLASSSTLTKVELRHCGIGHQGWLQLKRIVAIGLLWKRTCKPSFAEQRRTQGRELRNPALAKALTKKTRFTAEEWEGFLRRGDSMGHKSGGSYLKPAVRDLHDGDFIKSDDHHYYKPSVVGVASGLKWLKADNLQRPMVGCSLKNSKLEDTLKGGKMEFTQQEWDEFGIKVLRMEDFITLGDSYLKPAVVSQTALLDLSGNRFSPALHEEE